MGREPEIGYTACMMMNLEQRALDYQRVEQAIQYLERNFRRHPSLDEVAGDLHLSKYYVERLFKRWAGISPTQFMHYLSLEYAKERLRESQSVLDASLDSGLSGPGRLHDLFVTFEAITPGEYKRRGAGLSIVYGVHDTPFGKCLLATTARGICALHFVQGDDSASAVAHLSESWPAALPVEDASKTQPLIDSIFSPIPPDRRRPFHLLLRGTNFQVRVWEALLQIPPGALLSYQDVAALLGMPGGARAVGGAVAVNPVAYLIPCHRVINKTGRLHRYRWGSARKKAMVVWEAERHAEGEDPGH